MTVDSPLKITLAAAVLAFATPLAAQVQSLPPTSVEKLQFDVASVKQNLSPDAAPYSNFPLGPGAMYTPNGGVFSARNMPAFVYIMFAYRLTDHEVMSLRKQLPGWASDERFDIEARTDLPNPTKDKMRLMMRSLLADRFKLDLHFTTEQVSVYELVVAKPGTISPGLRLHPPDGPACSNSPPAPPGGETPREPKQPGTVAGGFPVICGGAAIVSPSGPARIAVGYRDVPMGLIALQMTQMGGLDRPVLDQTGLTGNVDFLLEFTPESPPGAQPSPNADLAGPSFRQALLEQTGLRLISQKGPVDTVFIDHIQRPSSN